MKLGTGVNIQERLAVAHHIDCPFRPSDVEQRDGRINRQGNLISEIEIIRYGIEQTLDAGMYAILERKQKFINDALIGRCARTIEEINDDSALDYASFSAAISGNPKLKRKVVIETRLKELDALERQHRRNVRLRLDQKKSLTPLIPAMKEEIPQLEAFIARYPTCELGSLPIRYGNRELTGTLREKGETLDRIISSAYMMAIRECSFLKPEGIQVMEDLTVGNFEFHLIAKAQRDLTSYDPNNSAVIYQLRNLTLHNLPVKLQNEARDGESLLYGIRKMVSDKSDELSKCKLELEAKIARLEKLQTAPMEEFNAGKEKSELSLELEQIIFELNKTSEGQRRHYESQDEPLLSSYFPFLGKTKSIGHVEILDGGNDEPEFEESALNA